MQMPIDNPQEVALWTGGGLIVLLALRQLYKLLRADVLESKGQGRQDEVLGHYKDLADRYKKEADENARRADEFAEERNKAIEEVGKLRGEVVSLTRHVEQLQAQILEMHQVIESLRSIASSALPAQTFAYEEQYKPPTLIDPFNKEHL